MIETLPDKILMALSELRLHATRSENYIHGCIAEILRSNSVGFKHEAQIGPHSRVDFLCDEGIAIEVKRGKVNTRMVSKQIERYCKSDMVKHLILVTERGLHDTISHSNGKQVRVVSLTLNWGIAL